MASHPDLAAEQAYIDNAYRSLERSREEATRLRSMVEVGKGGTEQARWEREMIEGNIAQRLASLQLGDASLVFGRIDRTSRDGGDSYYIGRLAVSDEHREPLVVDWRAPVAEPFYRATGREPMGLVRRRHFATRGRQLLAIEDELFGESAGLLGGELSVVDDGREIRGRSTLITALEEARTGRLSDIVATIQGEQDEIIRAELPGVLVVQGGPGTGKTVVALHRAAYLLYTHRFPLEGQGVLVVGPNRLFLGYIEQVLPSLGEAGVELAVLADLLDGTVGVSIEGRDRPLTARVKGDLRMAKVLAKAVHDRQRPLRRTMRVGYGLQTLSLTPGQSQAIVADAKRRFRLHNAGRKHVEASVFATLADSARVPVEAARGARAAPPRPRGPRGPRADVAGAHPGRPAPRPVRLGRPHRAGRRSRPQRRRAGGARAAARRARRGRGVDGRRRPAARRGPRPARSQAEGEAARASRPTTTRAPTATSWSTRRRTSRRCSCGCSPAGRSTAR